VKFSATELPGVWLVDIEPRVDERGLFARTVCTEEFARHGLDAAFVQSSVSVNRRRSTLRGIHFQAAPHAEIKLVRCTRGAVFDVAVDLRPDSPTYRRWTGAEISAENHRAIYIPKGVAHGFQTLTDETELLYQMTVPYHAESSRGYRWDDPAFAIAWPDPVGPVMNERDAMLPLLEAP
jgi:dTDP-4-dehydrorhamnose 3,5-epimerase